ncbi:hypothetical protein NQ314_002922 [Rhamnusium bicolor]|uniref:Uncharacterized protein n=1 Tax=Rhamnusium bicolor TaxID=1586634 RepID=A0AAV8ZRT4_9CUCU|nr:hypothetical protein NQ314_002922 [Rhamnusium bicolor]
MLHYQKHNYAPDKGISRISIEGNDFNNNCEQELQELEKLIMKKLRGSTTSTATSISTSRTSSKRGSQSSLRKRHSRASLI